MKKHIFLVYFLCCALWLGVIIILSKEKVPLPSLKQSKNFQIRLEELEDKLSTEIEANKVLLEHINRITKENIEKQREELIKSEKRHASKKTKLPAKEEQSPSQEKVKTAGEEARPILPVLLFACDRPTVKKALDLLVNYRPSKEQFPIIVSQDCGHKETAAVIRSYGDEIISIQQPDLSEPKVPVKEKKFRGYFKIARHYGWALNQTFNELGHQQVIIVEDDLEVSSDFYEYFLATLPLLRKDKSLWCVSAWNDNGKQGLIDNNATDLLYRTDFFPGLGWMITKELWSELGRKWPRSYWDDWMRDPGQRKERACIRPEISRTKTFGKIGVSNGLFYEKHLKYIVLNTKFVPFTSTNLSYLEKKNYDSSYIDKVYQTPLYTLEDIQQMKDPHVKTVRLLYRTRENFKKYSKSLGIMDDFKSGVPRMAYRGVVSFLYRGRRIYLAPSNNWQGYNPQWA